MTKKFITYTVLIIIGALIGSGGFYLFTGESAATATNQPTASTENKSNGKKILYWRAPMNPNEIYDHPGKSNMGMDLVPVYADDSGESGVVSISPVMQQNMNVKIETVKSGMLNPEVFTNGILQTDEQREYVATTKISGWIDKLYINYTGQKVSKGDKLIRIYSPELVAAQEEFLTALSYDGAVSHSAGNSALIKNAIRKLQLFDVSDAEIRRLKKTKKVNKYVTLYSPISGTVIFKGVNEGAKINRGTPLLKVADLSNLWILADIYEYEASKIQLGLKAKVTFDYLPGKVYEGKISFIYPTVDTKTRTLKVRLDIPNKNGELKPGMFANVNIQTKSNGVYPLVPEQAILRSGRKNTVIIALGDGKFKPAQIELGEYADGYYQVLSGLTAGTKIVTSAQFLIDSESNLRSSIEMFNKAENDGTEKKEMKNMDMNKKDASVKKEKKLKSDLVREGVIDVEAIDANKDGKLFQDVMDWNVISDKPGKCPLCGMTLQEMTIEQVKKNLKEHGFEYK